MNEQLINLLVTIISGVVVFVVCQLFAELILRPIQEYKKLKCKVAKSLVLYARYYSNPQTLGKGGEYSAWACASDQMRDLAAEVAGFAEIKPWQIFVFYAIPNKQELNEAYHYLIGLSNSFFKDNTSEESCYDRVSDYPDIIKKHMGITQRRKK